MKAALALQSGVLEAYAADPTEGQVNLLYLSVGDEESYSRGMRGALGLLTELQEKFDLNYVLAVDSEPFTLAQSANSCPSLWRKASCPI